VLESGTTRGDCDSAELTFIGHQLRVALLKGTPASFEQRPQTGRQAARGRANSLEYNLDAGVISLGGDAWVSDGSNEVSGERLSYDLRKQFVLADSSGGKQVRMRISPPPRKATTGKAP
jgi:lipopolysaccharide export system protein LptA